MADSFVHLHVHSEYSTLDGACAIDALVKRAHGYGMPAIGLTDHGVMYGAVPFIQAAEKKGVKPIIGCELYVAPGSLLEKKASSQKEAAAHLTVLAENAEGYANLVKVVSVAHLDGMYYKPRTDHAHLQQHAKGLICLSGCLGAEIPQAIGADDTQRARELIGMYRDIFGRENFFLELMGHELDLQKRVNRALVEFSREFGLPLVASNDVHFLDKGDHAAHDALICIGTGANIADEKRLRYANSLYLKSAEEMRALFVEVPEACNNTLAIAERCGFKLDKTPKEPKYTPPDGKSQGEYLREIVNRGLVERYGPDAQSEVVQRRYEIEIALLERQGFVNYFLIVWDFIHWAKQQGIPVGPGRGSAAGSMVAYAMGITDIDPIRFKLLFERFLNPERVSPPDIDVDFCQNRRGEVIDYVRKKYSERAVSQIITFSTLGAKSVIRDTARVLGFSYSDGDRIAKMIPTELGITLTGFEKKNPETGEMEHEPGAIDKNPELRKAVETEEQTARLWEIACKLEGLTRGTGVHAAGVVICDRDLSEYIPLSRANDGAIVSQYDMGSLTEVGMLKCDFLGLKTLTVITDAVSLIRRSQPEFDIAKIPLEDAKTFAMLNRGETTAVFQLESGGMVSVCRQFDIKDIEDINAILALYRPGPMDLIPDYIKRKKGQGKIKYAHPELAKVCAETYGVLVYQEQVMQAAQVLAGYTLGGADLLRRAMGKKDKAKMAVEREKFKEGAAKLHGIAPELADQIFDLLEKFAGYGFNRSHSAAYAWISYQTAFLKANYPVEFMAAVLSNEVSNTDKIAIFVAECERMGIQILPPDINLSGLNFAPERLPEEQGTAENLHSDARVGVIRYGLAAIKNVGEGAMVELIREREENGSFRSLEDLCARVDGRKLNKKVLESLVKCGALDFLKVERALLDADIDSALASAATAHRDRAAGQFSLFDLGTEAPETKPRSGTRKMAEAANVQPWSQAEKLAFEKELLGFYVTGHPLDEYRTALRANGVVEIARLGEQEAKSTVTIAGALQTVEQKYTKNGNKPFAVVTIEDLTGTLEVMVWSEAYTRSRALLVAGNVVSITGRLDLREEGPRIAADTVKPLQKVSRRETPVLIRMERSRMSEEAFVTIQRILMNHPGNRPVHLELETSTGQKVVLVPSERYRVAWSPTLEGALAPWMN